MKLRSINPFRVYSGLPAPVYVLFGATLVNGMGIFVYPFLTLYLTMKLGYSVQQAGLFMFIASCAYVPGTFIGGKICDHWGRRGVLFCAQSMASLMFLICGLLGESHLVPWFVLANLFFDGFADPARSAMSTDVTTTVNRQKAFALNYLGHNLGYSVGPIIAGFLFQNATSWLFFGNAIAGFAAASLTVALIPETRPGEDAIKDSLASDAEDRAVEGGLLAALKDRWPLLLFGFLITLYGFSYGQTLFSMPLSAVAVFGDEGPKTFGLLMSLNAIIVIFLNAPIVSLSRRFRTLSCVAVAGVLYALGYAGYIFAGGFTAFVVCTVLWTLGEIVDAVNTWYYIANKTPMSHRGRFSGIFPFITGSGRALAPWIGGRLIQALSLTILWAITAAVSLIGAAGIRILSQTALNEKKQPASCEPPVV